MDGMLQTIQAWWQFVDYCFNHNPSAQMCESFWTNAIGAFIACGTLMVLYGIWKILDYRRKARSAAIAEWERNSVDEAGIREAMWRGEDSRIATEPKSDTELVAQIRAGVEQRKQETATHGATPAEPSKA